ncbi:Beta-galactosidase BoGH2A [Diplonema papillatum]|nr:Beta-galactosidase BoGH2A [Diplonema papillatum]
MMSCCYDENCRFWTWLHTRCLHGGRATSCVPSNGTEVGGFRATAPPFIRDFSFAQKGFDDSKWTQVATPHDYSINQTYANDPADPWHGFLPRNTSWYRKHFHVPDAWRGQEVYLLFEGARQYTEVYVNGEWVQDHASGYTEFTVRLDNVSSLAYGEGVENVVAVRTDGTYGSGHWYEGGGIYRDVRIIAVNASAHFTHGGVYVNPESDGRSVLLSAEVESSSTALRGNVTVTVELSEHNGTVLASGVLGVYTIDPAAPPAVLTYTWSSGLPRLQNWTLQNPHTYVATFRLGDPGQPWSDTVRVVTGFRTTRFGAKFALGGVPLQLQGFSHHTSFAGVGAVSNPRLNLFRVQTSKAVGANFWRCSHNPYEQHLYEILAYTGVLAWDENRDFGVEYQGEMQTLVKTHRNHAPIVLWSYCNEEDCEKISQTSAAAFRRIADDLDPLRATTANNEYPSNIDFEYLDVVGFTHAPNSTFETSHADYPGVPLLLSECCPCSENRMDSRTFTDCIRKRATTANNKYPSNIDFEYLDVVGFTHAPNSTFETSHADYPGVPLLLSECCPCSENRMDSETNQPGTFSYVGGSTGVWTLMDYFGESVKWPFVASAFGQFDIGGFPKAHAWWYRINWLAKVPATSPSRPLISGVAYVARVLNTWTEPMGRVNGSVSTLRAAMYYDGAAQPTAAADVNGFVSWPAPPGSVTNVTIAAVSTTGEILASHSLFKPKPTLRLQLVIDVPSVSTGTGTNLYLDGRDMALIRAQVVDSDGVVDSSATGNVTFSVAGSGRLVGLGSAPDSHLHQQGRVMGLYGGLIRAVAMVTLDCTSPNLDLALAIDSDHAPLEYAVSCPPSPAGVTIEASSDSYGTASVTVPVSSDPSDHPFAVARANANLRTYTYMDDIVS